MSYYKLINSLLLVFSLSKYVDSREYCHYYDGVGSTTLRNIWCAGRCCYNGNNYFNSRAATCCAYSYSSYSYWWISLPLLFFGIFLSISLLKICCFRGRPMVFGRRLNRNGVNRQARNPTVYMTNNSGYNPQNSAYIPPQSVPYPRQYQSGIQNNGFTGSVTNPYYSTDMAKDIENDPPKYEELNLNNDNKNGQTATQPIGFKTNQ